MTDPPLFDPQPYDRSPNWTGSAGSAGSAADQSEPAIIPVRAGTTVTAAFLKPDGRGRRTPTRTQATWQLLTGGDPPQAHLVYAQVERGAAAVCGRIGAVLAELNTDLPACTECYKAT